MESETSNLSKQQSISSFKTILILIIFVLVGIWLFGKIQDGLRPKSWTLFVYQSETPDTYAQKARIDTYQNQTTCIEKGISFTKKGGSFECGYDCRFRNEYLTEVCDKVCGINGCRD